MAFGRSVGVGVVIKLGVLAAIGAVVCSAVLVSVEVEVGLVCSWVQAAAERYAYRPDKWRLY